MATATTASFFSSGNILITTSTRPASHSQRLPGKETLHLSFSFPSMSNGKSRRWGRLTSTMMGVPWFKPISPPSSAIDFNPLPLNTGDHTGPLSPDHLPHRSPDENIRRAHSSLGRLPASIFYHPQKFSTNPGPSRSTTGSKRVKKEIKS
jgi:hypothetical protein